MPKLYAYNQKTKALHIYGYCRHSTSKEYLPFDSEEEAIAYAGRQIFLCKLCEKKREELLRNKNHL